MVHVTERSYKNVLKKTSAGKRKFDYTNTARGTQQSRKKHDTSYFQEVYFLSALIVLFY